MIYGLVVVFMAVSLFVGYKALRSMDRLVEKDSKNI